MFELALAYKTGREVNSCQIRGQVLGGSDLRRARRCPGNGYRSRDT